MAPALQLAEGFSITLSHAAPSDQWMAVAVVVTKTHHRHRITFVAEQPMEDVFSKELVDVIAPILNGFGHKNSVYTNPDIEVNLPGLSMQHMRVIFSTHDNAPSRALVRFAVFAGNPHRALLADDGFSYPLDTLATKVYRDALDWVLLPALNIASVDETAGFASEDRGGLERAMDNLRASKEQLLFQVELVKRELGRLEAHTYAKPSRPRMLMAAEPPQEEFRTLRIIKDMD